ncbi:MAG: hypothetical protein KAT28_05610 [Candidatus Aenigmarchaeota archaeon]|nr:hypothetical protein [Candidatus Aenigmarchaeota archaeon]
MKLDAKKSELKFQILKKSAIATLIYTAFFGIISFFWRIPNVNVATSTKVALFLAGVIGFFLVIYFLFRPTQKQSIYYSSARKKIFFVLAIIILLIEFFLIFNIGLCLFEYQSYISESSLEYHKICYSDKDCSPIGCGTCVNSEGLDRYKDIGIFCMEPGWLCRAPDSCVCVNETCTGVDYRNSQ